MIFQNAKNCGKVLFSLNIPETDVVDTKELWEGSEELKNALCSPSVKKDEKYAVIDKLFPKSIGNFLKVICDFGYINILSEIILAYENEILKNKNILRAKLYYVTKPEANVIENFKKLLCDRYKSSDVQLELIKDESLIGGYRLKVNDLEFDKSIQGTIKSLQNKLIWR